MSQSPPSLQDIIARYQLMAKKSLGQHFLFDRRLMQRITALAAPLEGCNVIEVGPGPGGLTRELLEAGANVYAIEMDTRCVPALEELGSYFPGQLTLHHGDALKVDATKLCSAPRKIVANLPYNVSTILLAKWLEDLRADETAYASMSLMFQKEVGQRIAAPSGNKAYGRLSVMAQWLCDVQMGFDIPPGAFVPPPKIYSSVIQLTPKALPEGAPAFAQMETLLKHAFGQRRKMLRAALKPLWPDAEKRLSDAGIEPTLRAEQLSVAQFVTLAKTL